MSENNGTNTDIARVEPGHIQEAEAMTKATAEIQSAMIVAKRFPRDIVRSIDRIKAACSRPALAGAAMYTYARGGTDITGPSIRLAEALAQNWGNLSFGIREIEQRQGESTVEAFCWDLETNTKEVKVFQVKHERHTKKGSYKLEDSRDIYELVANQGARRLRACILGIIPTDVVEEAVQECERTLVTKADITPERISEMVTKFKAVGVTRQQIEARIQRHLDSITPTLLISLGKIYNAIKDGLAVVSDFFPVEQATEAPKGTKGIVEALKAKRAAGEEQATDFGKNPTTDPAKE
jgi:hypothetical protein